MSFVTRKIQLQFSLANGEFEGGGNSQVIMDLRASIQMHVAGNSNLGEVTGAVYGLPLSTMQKLATVGSQWSAVYHNGVDILAGDDESGMSLIFSGSVFMGYVDAAQMPETCFRFIAQPMAFAMVAPVAATSIKGAADVAGLIQNLVAQTGLQFKNNNVSSKLSNPYLWGSAWNQIRQVVDAAGIDAAVHAGVFTISPRGSALQDTTPVISPETGLVSYPVFSQNQIVLRTLFNPQVTILGAIEVQSSFQPACGKWQVIAIDYDLDSVTPGGNWYQTIFAVPLGTH